MPTIRATSLVLCALAVASSAHAVPTTITYAGFLVRDGTPTTGDVDVIVELFAQDDGGAAVFTESFTDAPVLNGDLVLELGLTTVLDDEILTTPELWLEITVDGDALTPRTRISSVPYALRAEDAATVGGLSASDIADQVSTLQAQIDLLQNQITVLQGRANTLEGQMTALGSPGGPAVAFANVVGFSATGGITLSNGQISITNAGITGAMIGTDTITASNINANAIGNSEMGDNAIGNAEVADNAITANEIASSAVGASEIESSAVGTSELVDGNVTKAKIRGADMLDVWAYNSGCPSPPDRRVYLANPGNCTTTTCTPCSVGTCYRQCDGTCVTDIAAPSCPGVVIGRVILP